MRNPRCNPAGRRNEGQQGAFERLILRPPIEVDLNPAARFYVSQQITKRRFRVRQMVQHADGIYQVEALRFEWKMVDVGLRDANIVQALVVGLRDFNRGADVDGPDLGAVPRGVIGVASAAASRVQNAFASERFRSVGRHVIPEVALPLGAHFGKTAPLEPEAPGRLHAQSINLRKSRRRAPTTYRLAHRGGDHPWNSIHHWKGLVTPQTS